MTAPPWPELHLRHPGGQEVRRRTPPKRRRATPLKEEAATHDPDSRPQPMSHSRHLEAVVQLMQLEEQDWQAPLRGKKPSSHSVQPALVHSTQLGSEQTEQTPPALNVPSGQAHLPASALKNCPVIEQVTSVQEVALARVQPVSQISQEAALPDVQRRQLSTLHSPCVAQVPSDLRAKPSQQRVHLVAEEQNKQPVMESSQSSHSPELARQKNSQQVLQTVAEMQVAHSAMAVAQVAQVSFAVRYSLAGQGRSQVAPPSSAVQGAKQVPQVVVLLQLRQFQIPQLMTQAVKALLVRQFSSQKRQRLALMQSQQLAMLQAWVQAVPSVESTQPSSQKAQVVSEAQMRHSRSSVELLTQLGVHVKLSELRVVNSWQSPQVMAVLQVWQYSMLQRSSSQALPLSVQPVSQTVQVSAGLHMKQFQSLQSARQRVQSLLGEYPSAHSSHLPSKEHSSQLSTSQTSWQSLVV